MSPSTYSDLGNKPITVIIGLIASILGVLAFLFGKQSIPEFLSKPTSTSSSHIVVTVVVTQSPNQPIQVPRVIVVTSAQENNSPKPSSQSSSQQQVGPQYDGNDSEGFLRWYFHEIWATRNYDYLWDYLSDDFRQHLDLSYSGYEAILNAIGSIQEPIDISFEGLDGISLKYRVQYTILSQKNGYTDKRKDLYWLYFSSSKGHWEFK